MRLSCVLSSPVLRLAVTLQSHQRKLPVVTAATTVAQRTKSAHDTNTVTHREERYSYSKNMKRSPIHSASRLFQTNSAMKRFKSASVLFTSSRNCGVMWTFLKRNINITLTLYMLLQIFENYTIMYTETKQNKKNMT